jgi:16S rRNA processing protein RimM
MSSSAEPAWLRAGRVGRPHGLDGSFYVTDPKPQLLDLGRALVLRGATVTVTARKGTDARPIVRLERCTDRAGAEALRGEQLLARRAEAPPLGEDEWWEEELEGCTVQAEGGRAIGVVTRLVALPSCEALDVERADGAALLVPLVSGAVRRVDVGRREIEIDLGFLGEVAPPAGGEETPAVNRPEP